MVDIAYRAALCTTDIINGVNTLTGATRATGAAEPALFQYPGYNEGSAAPKRKRATATSTTPSDTHQQLVVPGPSGVPDNPPPAFILSETAQEDFAPPDEDPSPKITVTHGELRKMAKQCFCGEELASLEELQAHKNLQHLGQGAGMHPKKNTEAQGSVEMFPVKHGVC